MKNNVYQRKPITIILKAVTFNWRRGERKLQGKNRADTKLVEMQPKILPHENRDRGKQSC